MGNHKTDTLYHYCSLDTFLCIVKNSSIWLSDVQKSNDSKELAWFRHQYYDYISDKYKKTDDKNIKQICEIILSIALEDGYNNVPSWLRLSSGEISNQLQEIFNSLRVYAFCFSELSDSLGQWRGYANDGKGVAIGFSKEYFESISGHKLSCPYFNFLLGNISYNNKCDYPKLFDEMFSLHDSSKTDMFVLNSMFDLINVSALFKHPSFSEEREWRIIYLMNDYLITSDMLNFKNFDSISSEKYKNNFTIPKIDYTVRETDILSHIEIGIKDISKAINSIILGPKCTATEKDIQHLLLRFGLLSSFDSQDIKILRSDSSYR